MFLRRRSAFQQSDLQEMYSDMPGRLDLMMKESYLLPCLYGRCSANTNGESHARLRILSLLRLILRSEMHSSQVVLQYCLSCFHNDYCELVVKISAEIDDTHRTLEIE